MGLAPPSLSGREACPFRFPSPRGGPLPGSSHPWCLSGSLRRATWGSRRGRVEGGGAPAARVGRAPRSQHCPLPAAGWGPGCRDTVPGLMLPGAGSLGSALCPPLPQWPLIAVSRPQLSPPPQTPVPRAELPLGPEGSQCQADPTQFIRGGQRRHCPRSTQRLHGLLGCPPWGPR